MNDIYEFKPKAGPSVWGTAYAGEALVIAALFFKSLMKPSTAPLPATQHFALKAAQLRERLGGLHALQK